MVAILIREAEGCAPDPFVIWDSGWRPNDGSADWALAGADEPQNRGGLRSLHALETAVILALFTDKRIDNTHPLFWLADGDPRGWWGDAVDLRDDLGEGELGSLLWLLERAPLTINGSPAARWAEQMALEALAPLQSQGAVVRIEAEAEANELKGRLELVVRLYGRDGAAVFDRKFDLLWQQVAASGPPPTFVPFPVVTPGSSLDFSDAGNGADIALFEDI